MTTPTPPHLMLTPRGEEKAYFNAAREHRLVYQRCDNCANAVFYPRSICPHCHSESLTYHESAGLGAIYTYTVQHRPANPALAAAVPQTMVLVDLDEGFRLLADLVDDVEPRIGMPVTAIFDDVTEEISLVRFRARDVTEEHS